MLKKIAIAALLVAAGLFVWKRTDARSYVSTVWDQCKAKAMKHTSLEFEIDRIRKDIDRLIPDMKKNLGVLAKEMVEVENLREEIASIRTNLEKQKGRLKEMKDALQNEDVSPIVFNGRTYSPARLRNLLISDLASCQRCEEALTHKENLLEAKERAVDAAREQLAAIRGQKQELELQLAQLEADVMTLRVAQARSKVHFDDSALARVKNSLAQLRDKLKVEVRKSELEGQFVNEFTVAEPRPVQTNSEVIQDVEAYLKGTAPQKAGDRVAGGR